MRDDLADLVNRATAGDTGAVEALLVQHLPALRAFVRLKAGGMLLQRESCSDLAQSVCRDVLENAGRFRWGGEPEFRKWLFTTAMRKIADRYGHWRAEKRQAGREEAIADEQALQGYQSFCTPSRAVGAKEELARVEDAFAHLAPDKQQVILMARLFGMSAAQIGAELSKTEGAVRTMLSRALAELSERL